MSSFTETLKADWSANRRNPKGRLVLLLFRVAHACSRLPAPIRHLTYPYVAFYRILVEWLLGIEIPWKTKIGPGLSLYHGVALVINDSAQIGQNCVLRHSTTIGVKRTSVEHLGEAPRIGNNVDIGVHVVILGAVYVGDNAVIGAGSVVVKDVPAHAFVAGNPAQVIRAGEKK